MFIGHFALGFAAKSRKRRPSLGTLLMASQLIDLLWPFFLIVGLEQVSIDPGNTVVTPFNFEHYPFSHSLFATVLWGFLFSGVYYFIRKDVISSLVLGALVLSHWVLDFITHRPDLPLAPGSDMHVGLGLWNSLAGTIVLEGLLFTAGVCLYLKATKPINKQGSWALWSFIVFLVAMYFMNIFGPPPPSADPIGIAGLSMGLLVAWGYWIDKNREAVAGQ